ncbi:hypothetical protein C2S51_011656 [Perilla frutescens var. frutescens]|nr:hypothetical protein C2S51_011656 [Perilla frutescens var. frutescens]
MATTVDAVNPPPPFSSHARSGITPEHLNRIDINLLSQSELQALSLCSTSAFDDAVSPQVDRSVFNESAGSRRQTYSRLHHRSHSRLPRLHPSLKPHSYPHHSSDPENLKFKRNRVMKNRNLSKAKLLENGVGIELQRVNGKSEIVDFAELEKKGDELYADELKRRTAGLETEEAVLGFLRDLEGQWCSRRKKRKYVDAGALGDALPVGWKLLLGLRRRDYRVSVYCRRYISPTGQQFVSCKEAASFLNSHFRGDDADQQKDRKTSSTQHTYALSSEMDACPADTTDDMPHDIVAHSALARNSSNSHENENCLMGIENLPEVQVRDIFECFKCKLTFDEKDVYLQHLFSFHQKTTKRYKLGTPVGEGVIIRDGKYECQFCHKVFQERRSYNGHVGSHVRNTGKNSSEPAAPIDAPKNAAAALQEGMPSGSSKMDALIEIAHNSIFETSTSRTGEQALENYSADVLRVEEAQAASSCHEEISTPDPAEIQAENTSADRTLFEDLNHGGHVMTEDNDILKACNVNIKTDPTLINDSEPVGSCEIQKYENSSLDGDYRNKSVNPNEDHLQDTTDLTVEEMDFEGGVSSVPMTQSFQFFPPFDSVTDKGEHEFSVDEKLENVTAFEELEFDDMEAFKYGFGNGQELSSLPGGSINLDSNSVLEDGFNSSVRFDTGEIMLNTLHTNQLTVCVWCRAEFRLEGIGSETLSDSIGYMCPTCKAKISGHFDGGLSMDPHNF